MTFWPFELCQQKLQTFILKWYSLLHLVHLLRKRGPWYPPALRPLHTALVYQGKTFWHTHTRLLYMPQGQEGSKGTVFVISPQCNDSRCLKSFRYEQDLTDEQCIERKRCARCVFAMNTSQMQNWVHKSRCRPGVQSFKAKIDSAECF